MNSSPTVLITGAAGGLGRAFALGFAARGYAIAAADIDAAGTQETVRLVRQAGAEAAAFTVAPTRWPRTRRSSPAAASRC